MTKQKLNVALVGLRFGGAFVPIWYDHPDVERLGVCDFDANLTKEFVKRYPKLKPGFVKKCSSNRAYWERFYGQNQSNAE